MLPRFVEIVRCTVTAQRRVQVPFDPSRAKVMVAFVSEDEDLVTEAAIDLARVNRARLILYDRDAASAFADPMPNQWASSGERDQYGDRLGDDELVKLGREPLARKVA